MDIWVGKLFLFLFKVTTDTKNHNSCTFLPYNFNNLLWYLPETFWHKRNWHARRKYYALNYLQISAWVTASVYYFTIVLYGKTAVKRVKAQQPENLVSKLDESCSEPWLCQTVD